MDSRILYRRRLQIALMICVKHRGLVKLDSVGLRQNTRKSSLYVSYLDLAGRMIVLL